VIQNQSLKKFCTTVLRRTSAIEIIVKCTYDLYGGGNQPTGKIHFKTNIELGLKYDLHLMRGESAASFCRKEAAWVPDMFCNFYLVKNNKIANNSATTEHKEKNLGKF
jgi:hypothetical protein